MTLNLNARLKRVGALLLSALLLLVLNGQPLWAAQNRPGMTTLAGVKLVSDSSTESQFLLEFAPAAPSYTPAFGQPNQPGIGLAGTLRGPRAVQPSGMNGLVRGLEFRQEDSILIVRFQTVAATATVSASQSGPTGLEVTVTSGNARRGSTTGGTATTIAAPPPPPAFSPVPGEDGFELVMLKYADVSEVVGLLTEGVTIKSNDVFVPKEPAFGSNSLTGSSYNPTPIPTQPGESDEPLGQSVDQSMSIDRRLNAIWLKGSPDRIARMKAMIAMIDIPVDSVILETQMVELTEQGQKAVGIDFTNANGQLGVVTLGSGGFIPLGISQGCDSNSVSCSGHVSSAQFQASIYAQILKGNGRIISKPRIAALSGSTAKIITGDALPILTAITLSGVNGVSQQVQYVNVGVTLQIAPRVSGDGFVTSHVYAVVSSVTGFSQGYPTISQRQAETAATVRDGDSFVIGGLTQDETLNTNSKVPILGDIPLLGHVFRNEKNQRTKTELYIIITPRIIHRVGTAVLSTPRQEPYDSRPVTLIPSDKPIALPPPDYVPLTPIPTTGAETSVPPPPPPPRER